MGKNGDLRDFERGMAVAARLGGLSMSETADPLGFTPTTISGFTENGQKKRKYPVVDVRGQRRMGRALVPTEEHHL